jgi:hypothetical protein
MWYGLSKNKVTHSESKQQRILYNVVLLRLLTTEPSHSTQVLTLTQICLQLVKLRSENWNLLLVNRCRWKSKAVSVWQPWHSTLWHSRSQQFPSAQPIAKSRLIQEMGSRNKEILGITKTCRPVMPSFCSVSSKSGFTYLSLLSASSTAISKICPVSVPRITSLVDAAAPKTEALDNHKEAQNKTNYHNQLDT